MKLQLALDEMTLGASISFAEKLIDLIDIVEIGTPLMLREGTHAVRAFRDAFPDKEVLADTKIMDGGSFEAEMMFDTGADYVTALGVADPSTIEGCVQAAQAFGKQVVLDLLCVDDLSIRGHELHGLGVDVLAVHTGADQQAYGRTPLLDLQDLRLALPNAGVAVAGGISPSTIESYVVHRPDIVIVGSAICKAKDPRASAEAIVAEFAREH